MNFSSPADRELFAQHAPVSVIRSEMDQAYAQRLDAEKRIKWLTTLLMLRGQQFQSLHQTGLTSERTTQ